MENLRAEQMDLMSPIVRLGPPSPPPLKKKSKGQET
jgi:hypothetical protein